MSVPTVDAQLSDSLDLLAHNLDRVASFICALAPPERTLVLARLQRLSADLDCLLVELTKRQQNRQEPSASH